MLVFVINTIIPITSKREVLSSLLLSQGLRGHLLEELEQAFPEEVEAYRDIRAASAAVSSVCLFSTTDNMSILIFKLI